MRRWSSSRGCTSTPPRPGLASSEVAAPRSRPQLGGVTHVSISVEITAPGAQPQGWPLGGPAGVGDGRLSKRSAKAGARCSSAQCAQAAAIASVLALALPAPRPRVAGPRQRTGRRRGVRHAAQPAQKQGNSTKSTSARIKCSKLGQACCPRLHDGGRAVGCHKLPVSGRGRAALQMRRGSVARRP